MKLAQLKNKRILILGFGREGRDTLKFLERLSLSKRIGIADKKITNFQSNFKGVKYYFGRNYLSSIPHYDVIIKSPGIPYKLIHPFLNNNQRVTSQTDIFFDNFKGKVIGITGTKGKSTTTSLVYHLIKKSGLGVHLVGNIGRPVLTTFLKSKPSDIFVYELSCHQLYHLKKSPFIAVFLDIYPEHLDYYGSFKRYFRAKQNICLWQKKNDYFVFNSDFSLLNNLAQKVKSNLISFGFKPNRYRKVYFRKNWIYLENKKIISKSDIPLLGLFNVADVMATIAVASILKLSVSNIKEGIKSFKSLPHRLELEGKFNGIIFYNDSISTIPQSTIAALEALGESNVKTLILGGYDRGIDFSDLARKIAQIDLKNIIFFPPSGQRIYESILSHWPKGKKKPNFFFVNNMEEAVDICYKNTPKNKISLLSPASPSFGVFKDYRDRGKQFLRYIRILGRKRDE